MKLLEDKAKDLLRRQGIRVPDGYTVSTSSDVKEITAPVMVKALVPTGGRGKAGGIARADTTQQAKEAAARILDMSISGFPVRSVLIEGALDIEREIYLSISVDRSSGLPLLLAAASGGVEIEALPAEAMGRWTVHPFLGIEPHLIRELERSLGLEGRAAVLGDLVTKTWTLFRSMDCELVEINPLILSVDGHLVAADAKVTINDDALFRHPELSGLEVAEDELEGEARRSGIAFVRLDGDIGVIANGAGLTMATLDEVVLNGGRGGAFLDLGGTDDPESVERAFELLAKAEPKVVLINIFGGITKCDTVALGVIRAVDRLGFRAPIVARIRGVNEATARDLLQARGIVSVAGLEDAVKEAVRAEAAR